MRVLSVTHTAKPAAWKKTNKRELSEKQFLRMGRYDRREETGEEKAVRLFSHNRIYNT